MKIAYLIGLGAAYNGLGGAWKAWTVARDLDTKGSGKIAKDALKTALADYSNRTPRTIRRWIRQGKEAGIFREAENGDLYYCGLHKAAVKFEAWGVGRRVNIPDPKRLFAPDWKQYLWAIYHTIGKDRPVSRFTLEWLTGIDRQTQWNLGRDNPWLETRACYADIDGLAGKGIDQKRQYAANLREVTGEGWQIKRGQLVKQLPNVYAGKAEVELCPKGIERQAKGYFKAHSLNHGARVQALDDPERLFFETEGKAAKAVLRTLRKLPVSGDGTGEAVQRYYRLGEDQAATWYGEVLEYA